MTLFGLTSCVFDKLEMPEDIDPDISEEQYSLNFMINLQSMQSRVGSIGDNNFEDYEDYIDASKIYILFFTEEDELIKMFSSDILSLLPVKSTNDTYSKNWSVHIPISKINDGEDFAQKLRDDNFKIAVLANWDTLPNIDKGDNIDVLHHQSNADKEPYYKDEKKREIYQFLYKGRDSKGKMGNSTNWVQNNDDRFSSVESARANIRNSWNPNLEKNSKTGNFQYKRYTDLWFLWNFGGADNIESDFSSENNNKAYADEGSSNALKYPKWAGEWENRNGNHLRSWINEDLEKDQIRELVSNDDIDANNDINYLSFSTVSGAKAVKNESSAGSGKYYYGVNLPAIYPSGAETDNNYTRFDPSTDRGAFSFIARATGTLFITAKNTGNFIPDGKARLTAQVGYTGTKYDFKYENVGEVVILSEKVSITGNDAPVYIFNRKDNTYQNDIEIYQIEYIQDEYIYNADRSGVKPSTNQPIEMYGIQKFGALGNFWPKGTSFDLSNYNKVGPEYDYYGTVPLLRSVAKIELKIPRALGPQYVYLRSPNRKSRWEPLDISSNTNDIWEDFGTNSSEHPGACEWYTIRGQVPFYDGASKKTSEVQASNYQEKLAWYYGAWANEGKLGEVTVPKRDFGWKVNYSQKTSRDYPKILNPLIERSDFVEFIPAPDEGIYKRYVLYVGEKYVDDPNEVGKSKEMETSKPKICHIEFRLGTDISTNLDDNNCIRIYFIEGGHDKDFQMSSLTFESNQDWENLYEQNATYLVKHWPIMRNHVYSFTVLDAENLAAIVSLKVLPWKMVEGNNSYDW